MKPKKVYTPPRKPVSLRDYFRYPARPVRRGELWAILLWYERRIRQDKWWRRIGRQVRSWFKRTSPVKEAADEVQPEAIIEQGLNDAE